MTRTDFPECEVLFELFSAPRGRVLLGRLNSGPETGRVVRLRAVDAGALPLASEAVAATRDHEFSCPELLKLLDVTTDGSQSYVASEYLPGISLFELTGRARREGGLAIAAAVHIAVNALYRLTQARTLLEAAGRARPRLFYADCIWVTDYGETLLAEPGVSAYLSGSPTTEQELGAEAELHDVRALAVELYQLVSGKLLYGDLQSALNAHLPTPLALALTGLLVFDGVDENAAAPSFAETLTALPAKLMGDEALVASEVRRLAGDVLDERERRLAEFRTGTGAGTDGPTRVYSGGSLDYDSDELTVQVQQSFRRGVPVPRLTRAELVLPLTVVRKKVGPASHELAETSPASRALAATQPAARSRAIARRRRIRQARWARRARWLVATVLLLVALGATSHYRPAWLTHLVTRFQPR